MLAGCGRDRGRAAAARGRLRHGKFRCGHAAGTARCAGIEDPDREAPEAAVVIWIVVADDEVFVRSWLGARGRWYRDLAAGGPATLEFAGRRIEVQAFPANDDASIARASAEFLRKYQASSHAREMVRSEILSTTLRLEPGSPPDQHPE